MIVSDLRGTESPMTFVVRLWQRTLLVIAIGVDRKQQACIEHQQAEVSMLTGRISKARTLLTDDQRRRK